ncbi:MAG: CHASE2 domain-containing protein, partial [Chloroflexota bacterium]
GTQVIFALAGSPPAPQPLQPGQPPRFSGAIRPIPLLAGRVSALGHIHASPGSDGTVRHLPLIAAIQGETVPSLSLQAAAAYLRRPRPFDALGPDYVFFAGRPIPTDEHYQVRINYLGPPSHRPDQVASPTVPTVSFSDVLDGTFDRSVVADKVVFVGLTAIGFADDFWVPTSRAGLKMSGVEIHAQTTEMLLRGAYLQQQGAPSTIAAILLLSVVPGVILARFQPVLAGAATALLFLVYFAVAVYHGWSAEQQVQRAATFTVLNSVYPGVAMLATFVAVMLYRVVFEQAEQRATKGAMGKYLSSAVMTEVLKDPAALRLGGQKREMSVLFADIRGFTPVAERMDPQVLVPFLNEFLAEMTELVFAHQGVLDKYMGDGIMAFWGAPQEQPDHAQRACRAAYEMVRRLRELQQDWSARGLPPLDVGVGVNTGVMTVGNVGSKARFDYTVIGDAVNLAARLEPLNKEYGTGIIVGEATRQRVRDTFATRFLDRVTVRGKEEVTAIYELLAPVANAGQSPPGLPDGFLDTWQMAMEHYHARRFAEAARGFRGVLALKPDDGPARLFIARCEALAGAAPGVEWDDVSVLAPK